MQLRLSGARITCAVAFAAAFGGSASASAAAAPAGEAGETAPHANDASADSGDERSSRAAPQADPGGEAVERPAIGQRRDVERELRPGEERPVPDYDGRPEPTSLADAALWVPRVALFPLYVLTEYAIRRPLGWLVTTAERERWPAIIINFLTFDERRAGIVPTGMIDFGLRPSIGVYVFWNDVFAEDNDLRLRAAYGGEDMWLLRLTKRFSLGAGQLALTGSYESRPDNVFHGIGRDHDRARSRYFRSVARLGALYSSEWYQSSYARIGAGAREVHLDGERGCCGDPSLMDRVRDGAFEVPPGMNQVLDVLDQAIEVVFDSRPPRDPDLPPASDYHQPPGHGVRLAVRGQMSELMDQSLAFEDPIADAWLHYGASLGGFVDLSGEQRSLGLTVAVDFVEPLGDGEVPLVDLVTLGGERPMRGFLAGELVDKSGAALRLDYRWPVAVWLDGTLLYEVGNVFGSALSGFQLGQLRSSYGFGLQAVGAQDHVFQLMLAFGSESFDDGGRLDTFRFVFGTTAGF